MAERAKVQTSVHCAATSIQVERQKRSFCAVLAKVLNSASRIPAIWNLRLTTRLNPFSCRWLYINCTAKKPASTSQKCGEKVVGVNYSWAEAGSMFSPPAASRLIHAEGLYAATISTPAGCSGRSRMQRSWRKLINRSAKTPVVLIRPHRKGAFGTLGCANHHDLHPRAEPRAQSRAQPTG